MLRIGLASLTLVDLAARAENLDAFYTDEGVLPRATFRLPDWDFLWSFHLLSGGRGFALVLVALHALCAVALLVGFRTRLATLLCFLFTASLQARNPLLRDGHDDLIRVLLFWGLLLPWNARFSLDARAGRAREAPSPPSWAAAGFIAQVCVVYWAGAIGKWQSPWWRSGQAIANALSLGRYETRLGHWLLHFPRMLHALEPVVLAVEILLPALLLVSTRRAWVRTLVVVAMILLHASFGASLRLGLFPWVSAVAWLAMVPGEIWDRLLPATRSVQRSGNRESMLLKGAVIAGLVVTLGANLLVLGPGLPLAHPLGRLASLVGLQQYWLLFAPTELEAKHMEDGYYVEVGQRRSGESVDLMSADRQLTWQRPALISATYANRRWRHYLANLLLEFPLGSTQFGTIMASRREYARYLCRREAAEGTRLSRVSVYFLSHRFGRSADTPTRQLIAQEYCE